MSKKQNNTKSAAKPDKPLIAMKAKTSNKATGELEPPARDTSSTRSPTPASKIDTVITMLRSKGGVTIDEVVKATGWQAHSVRGAISGQLKKKLGLNVLSEKIDGTRLYRIAK
jgi:hypothetical protein